MEIAENMTGWIEHKLKLIFLDSFRHMTTYSPPMFLNLTAYLSSLLTYKMDNTKIRIMREELRKLLGREMPDKKIKLPKF
jgi:hypothetical protein